MESEPQPSATASAADRSTGRPTHTPRGARNGDHLGRPGALPPAPGRLSAALTPLAAVALLAAISWQVAVAGPLLRLDLTVRNGVRDLRHGLDSPAINHLAAALTDLGGTIPAVPALFAAAALAAWLERRAGRPRWWLPLPVAALSAVLIPLLVVPAKVWFARPGPAELPLLPHQLGWYPSGHTATSAICYGTAALLLGRVLAARTGRALYAGAALLCAAVAAGLLWCDYHWLLDILASWSLTALLLWSLTRGLVRPASRQ